MGLASYGGTGLSGVMFFPTGIFVVGYIRKRYHDADIYLFTFFGFCLLGMLENNFGLSLGVAVAVGLFALLLIILLYFYMLYFID